MEMLVHTAVPQKSAGAFDFRWYCSCWDGIPLKGGELISVLHQQMEEEELELKILRQKKQHRRRYQEYVQSILVELR